MQKLFKKSRLKIDEMIKDTFSFTKKVYNQSETLFTPASPWGQILTVLNNLTQLNLYYIEDSITELNIHSASRPNSIYGLSKLAGHNPTRAIAASGDLFLVYNGTIPQMYGQNVIIPNFVRLKCNDNNLEYVAVLGQDEIKINIFQQRHKIFLKVIQGVIESQQFTGTGKNFQTYEANMPEGKWIDNFFVNVFVNGDKWEKYDSLLDIPREEEALMVKTGMTSGVDVIFGNGNFGQIPDLGSTILVEYLVNDGIAGNIRETSGISFEFLDSGYDDQGNEINLNDIFNIGIATPITFGSNPEPTYLTRLLTPTTSRSYVLANTSNYESMFEKMQQFSYIDIYTNYDPYDPYVDNIVFILLIPDIRKRWRSGENYFNVPLKFFKLTDLEKFRLQVMMEESGKKVLGTITQFVDPKFKRYACNIYLNIWEGYDKQLIREKITSKLSDYMAAFRRKDFLPKSDLIAIIENVEGVDSVTLEFLSEDIETELRKLLSLDTMEDAKYIKESNLLDLMEYYLNAKNNNITLSNNEKLTKIFLYSEIQEFVKNNLDSNGDIVLQKNEIPLMRGGWKDRYGKNYQDLVEENKVGSVNVYFVRENPRDKTNKLHINNLRNNS